MPTLSASDYTQYLKFKAAAASPIRPAIQTRVNETVMQSILNANVLTSQAAVVVTPQLAYVTGLNYVRPPPPVLNRANPNALSTVTVSSGSVVQRPGGLPPANTVSTYTRLPQRAGW